MMTKEQIYKEIETIDNQIKALKENRCESLVCMTNENEKSLKIQELLEERMDLYYQLNINHDDVTKVEPSKELNLEEKGRYQEKIEIAKNLLYVLDDEVISSKIGLSLDEIKQLRK